MPSRIESDNDNILGVLLFFRISVYSTIQVYDVVSVADLHTAQEDP